MVGIQSSQDLASFWLEQYDASLFVKTIKHESLSSTLAALVEFKVEAVMAGSEPGVLLTEDLQDALSLPGNGAATKEWRRDKYAMQERLRELGIRAVHQLYSSDLDEILAWQAQWGKWPIIVKPSMSGGTDGVYWCHSTADVKRAFDAECGKRNVNGVVNEKLLVQEFLDGLEYIVDAVSHNGQHVLSGIWVYKKVKDPATSSISYEYARLLSSTGEEQDVLVEYVWKVLEALSIKHGPSHTEVIITSDGPCLVETGARMHGCKGPKLLEMATGVGTHELAVDVAVNNARVFNDLYSKSSRYTVKKWAFETFFRNAHAEGTLANDLDVPEIRNLASFVDVFPSVRAGEELKITRDIATSPGIVLQVHPVLSVVEADVEKIRELEKTKLYKTSSIQSSPGSPKGFVRQVSPFVMSPKHEGPAPENGRAEFSLDGLDDESDRL
jgi:biotin carboxylase